MNTELIKAENISFKINENRLFHNLTFSLNKGEALHITGSNGSGKSTLIRIILGITPQSKGSIMIINNNNICYLGHKNALKGYLSVIDNLMLHGLNNHKDLNYYLEKLDLIKFLDVVVANLSFGQQKKLALLRVFLNDSSLIILDEPFVGLDKDAHDFVKNFLLKELETGKAIVYTSHIDCEIESKVLNLQ